MKECKKCKYYHTDCDARFRCRADVDDIKAAVLTEYAEKLHSAISNRGCADIHDIVNEVMLEDV